MGYKVITLFSAMATFWLGLYVYRQNKEASISKRFYEFTTVLAIWIFTNFIVAMKPSAYLIQITYSMGTAAVFFGLLWVLWLIGNPPSKKIMSVIYAFCGLVIIIGFIPGTLIVELISYDFSHQVVQFNALFYPIAGIDIIGLFGIIILLVRQYKISKGIKRLRIKYLLFGLGFSCVVPLFGAFILPLFKIFSFTNYDAPCVIIFVVLASYTMSHYQLMSVGLLKTKVFMIFVVTVSLVASIVALSYIFRFMFGTIIGAAFGFLAFAIAITFLPANSIKKFIESHIIHEKYDLVKIMSDFSVQIGNAMSIKELANATVEFLAFTIKAPNVCLLLYYEEKFIFIASYRFASIEVKDQVGIYSLLEKNQYVIVDELKSSDKLFKVAGINPAILYPLKNKEGTKGFIVIGERNPDYEESDIEVLSIVNDAVLLNMGTALFYQQAMIDALTHLYTRRYFDLVFSKEVLACQKKQIPVSLLFVDIDNFKKYNDTYGHQKGDEVLALISDIIKRKLRDDDVVCRYGGEEIVVIVRETRNRSVSFESYCKGVSSIGARLCSSVRAANLTISIGICTTQKEYVPAKIVKVADGCLYQAKSQGKDRFVSEIL
ncbi:MAG: diguanylate cyclase [Caldisericia bacterium]